MSWLESQQKANNGADGYNGYKLSRQGGDHHIFAQGFDFTLKLIMRAIHIFAQATDVAFELFAQAEQILFRGQSIIQKRGIMLCQHFCLFIRHAVACEIFHKFLGVKSQITHLCMISYRLIFVNLRIFISFLLPLKMANQIQAREWASGCQVRDDLGWYFYCDPALEPKPETLEQPEAISYLMVS